MTLSKIKEQETSVAAQSSFKNHLRDTQQHFKVLHQATSSTQGKMNLCFCAVLIILLYLINRYSSVEIRPELQRNILKFGYGINYKYKGMLAHSFDRFYAVTKFILPTLDDLKLSPIGYDKEGKYI